MKLNQIDATKVDASRELDAFIHETLFDWDEDIPCPTYSSRRPNGMMVAARLEELYGIPIRLGRLRVQDHKMYFARAGVQKETSTEMLAVTLSLAVCRLAIRLLQDTEDGKPLLQEPEQRPSLPYTEWDDD